MPEAPRPRLVVSASGFRLLLIHRAGLFRALQDAGYTVLAVAPEGPGMDELRALGCEVEPIRMQPTGTSPLADLALYWRYVALFRRVKAAAFLGFTAKPNIYGTLAARLAGIPTINNISGLGRVFTRRSALTAFVEQLYRLAFRSACVVFFENRDDARHFLDRRLVRPEQVVNLPGAGLDLDKFAPAESPASAPFTFMLAARLLWDKGVQQFVDAAAMVRERHPETRFQIVGFVEPPSRDAVPRDTLEQWQSEGKADYLGETSDIRPLIAATDCVVLPSYYREGVPRILMEAAAMARPVITTDMPGCRDALDDGETGFLCEPRSVESLAEAMERLLSLGSEARGQMGRNARAKMERQFNQEVIHESYREALKRCISSKPMHQD